MHVYLFILIIALQVLVIEADHESPAADTSFALMDNNEDDFHLLGSNIVQVDSLEAINYKDLRYNTDRIYKLKNTPSLIIHKSKLRLQNLHKIGKKHIPDWIHVGTNGKSSRSELHFPISKCLNQQFGDGGSIDVQNTVLATMINTFELTLSLNVIFYSERVTQGWELTNSITMRNLYTCTVPDGMIGQIWARTDVIEANVDLSLIEIENVPKSKNKRIKLKLWKNVGKVKMFLGGGGSGSVNGAQKRPIISCVTDARLIDCSGKKLKTGGLMVI
ncbi:hypothetical protein KGF56_004757 [Candida oxycetoniae]|uniref:Hyphally-regulated cell wall protein N-terminal domain-containing protein n=1 Tax=Candida oxycetoniae TaxID=497107 RepID=A0AAI9SSS7_9ASCO|nr:uncharacterized protein KGF56_004757 [Candida oxycetoniae]KAI3402460.2 hypothetical protein KGF56_004757 [Candida oxycetoniae]